MQPRCRTCRYSLTDLPAGPCPECGTPFDPNDPTTLYTPSQDTLTFARFAPPNWFNWPLAALPLGYFVATNSPTGYTDDESALFALFLVFLPAIVWALPFVAHLGGRAALLFQRTTQPRWRWRWVAIPLTIALGITLQKTQALWRLRWYIARPHLEAFAKDPASRPGAVAGFTITDIQRRSDGTVHLTLGFPDSIYSDGPPCLIYAPNPHPWATILQNVDLGNSWFAWVDHS